MCFALALTNNIIFRPNFPAKSIVKSDTWLFTARNLKKMPHSSILYSKLKFTIECRENYLCKVAYEILKRMN